MDNETKPKNDDLTACAQCRSAGYSITFADRRKKRVRVMLICHKCLTDGLTDLREFMVWKEKEAQMLAANPA